jgi:hypothetical protein
VYPGTQTGWPAEHECAWHTAIPHWPQLLGSLLTSTHWPLHRMMLGPPVQLHWPPAPHVPAGPQSLPHWPQLRGSVARSTHAPLHIIIPDGQAQFDPTQV